MHVYNMACVFLSILATDLGTYFTGQVFARRVIFTEHHQWMSLKN